MAEGRRGLCRATFSPGHAGWDHLAIVELRIRRAAARRDAGRRCVQGDESPVGRSVERRVGNTDDRADSVVAAWIVETAPVAAQQLAAIRDVAQDHQSACAKAFGVVEFAEAEVAGRESSKGWTPHDREVVRKRAIVVLLPKEVAGDVN
ncbi:MAG: hypothetical protein RL385_5093, partial [Pseudomonadota bacterium]